MWCQQTNHYRRRIAAAYTAFVVLLVAVFTTAIFSAEASANASPARTLNFQGRLLRTTGAVVPDGYYNIQFNIYEGGSGTTANNPDGSLVWTENYVNSNTNGGVRVKNGLFSVNLGSVVPFGDSVDWNANTIWLSMNVAGSANDCMSFGTGSCVADGEMLPMKQMTATPFAMNAGQLGGKSAEQFLQLAQGVQTDPSNNTSISLNKTGSGDFVRLQKDGDEVFAISPNGNIRLGGVDDKSIAIQPAASGQNGANLTLSAGGGGSGNTNGGNLMLSGGAGSGTGVPGLVIMNTPTFQTSLNDANCFTGGSPVSSSCTFTPTSVNNSAVLMAGFSSPDQTASVPDPAIATAGRVMYITGAADSEPFLLRINPSSPAERNIKMQAHASLSLLWNGTDWTTVSTTYSHSTPDSLATNSSAESSGSTPDSLPPNTWFTSDPVTVSRNTTSAYVSSGHASIKVQNTGPESYPHIFNRLRIPLQPATTHSLSMKIYLDADTDSDIMVIYQSSEDTIESAPCTFYEAVTAREWQEIQCTFETPHANIDATNRVLINPTLPANSTLYIDDLNIQASSNTSSSSFQKPGSITTEGAPSADQAANAYDQIPDTSQNDTSLLGSMYYDESLGKIQCYESEGWGSCNTAPDTFISLSPAYPGVVVDESNTNSATFSTGFCSGSLGINSDGQTPVCTDNETFNYYQLSNTAATSQSSLSTLYVTHTLPDNFKEFVADTTHITTKSLGTGSEVRYQIYKNTNGDLTPCGEMTTATSGNNSSWQRSSASNASDPSSCGFTAGDSVLFKIELSLPSKPSAEGVAAAYVSDINFVYTRN